MSEEWTPHHEQGAWIIAFIPLMIIGSIILIPLLLGYVVDPNGIIIGLVFGSGFVGLNFLRLKQLKKEYGYK